MKKLTNSKLAWITALPVGIFTIIIKVLQEIGFKFPIDDYMVSYGVVGVILAMFIVNIKLKKLMVKDIFCQKKKQLRKQLA